MIAQLSLVLAQPCQKSDTKVAQLQRCYGCSTIRRLLFVLSVYMCTVLAPETRMQEVVGAGQTRPVQGSAISSDVNELMVRL